MKRLIDETVFSGLTAAWRRARLPTRRSPALVKAATDGVVRDPSALGMTTGSPPSMTAITELVVPRSIPTVFGICSSADDGYLDCCRGEACLALVQARRKVSHPVVSQNPTQPPAPASA